jgi:hypothetical protein
MSYFMTVAGSIAAGDVPPPAKLVPAAQAQSYIAKLEPHLIELDGGPVYLVDDGDSGTSEDVVMETYEALWAKQPVGGLPFVVLLERCFDRGWNFRVWLAGNDTSDHTKNIKRVTDVNAVLESIQNHGGVFWHAR